jgi:hypothetical protein
MLTSLDGVGLNRMNVCVLGTHIAMTFEVTSSTRSHLATEFGRNAESHTEGRVAKAIEQQTAKLPSDTFLWKAVGAVLASASLQAMGNRQVSLFVGQWAPTLLILGLYNKLVKQLGSDRTEHSV